MRQRTMPVAGDLPCWAFGASPEAGAVPHRAEGVGEKEYVNAAFAITLLKAWRVICCSTGILRSVKCAGCPTYVGYGPPRYGD